MSALLQPLDLRVYKQPAALPMETEENHSFADYLPWYDIIFKHILPCLDLRSMLSLHAVNQSYKSMVEEYFQQAESFNVNEATMTPSQFASVTSGMRSLKAVALGPSCWLTDRLATRLLSQNPKLMWISLRECPSLSNATILKLASGCPNLQGLNLTDCHWLSGDALRYLVRKCPHLQSLDLTRCIRMDDLALACIASGAKRLVSLSVGGNFSVTDRGVAHLTLLPGLRHLNVQYCAITDSALRLMLKYLRSLRHVELRGCRKITHATIARLSANNVQVDVKVRHSPLKRTVRFV